MFDLIGKTLQETKALLEQNGVDYSVEIDESNRLADEIRVVRMDSAYHLVCMGFLNAPKEEEDE